MDASTEDSNTPTDAQDKQVFLDNSNGEVVGTPIGDDSPTAATDSPLQSKTETEGDVDGENVEDVAQPSSDVIQVASGNVSQKSSRKPKGFSRGKIKSLEVFGLSIFVETDAGEKLDLKVMNYKNESKSCG